MAVLFAGGCALAPFGEARHKFALAIPVVCFAFICLLNCTSIEYRETQHFNVPSLRKTSGTIVWLVQNLRPIAALLALFAIVMMFSAANRELYGSIAIAALALIWFDRAQRRFSADQMRVAADLPLAAPLLFLITRVHGL